MNFTANVIKDGKSTGRLHFEDGAITLEGLCMEKMYDPRNFEKIVADLEAGGCIIHILNREKEAA